MQVAAIIVTYNGARWIRGALDSLRQGGVAIRAIVVDNASSDDTCRVVETEFPDAKLLRLSSNLGFGAGNNVGIREAIREGAEFLFLLNQDAFAEPDCVRLLLAAFEDDPSYAVLSPLHCSPNANAVDALTMGHYLTKFGPEYLSDACLSRIRSIYRIHGVNAAAWLVRASAFESVGGFDPLFFMYGEDDDLLARFKFHGLAFGFVPAARIVHLRAKAVTAPRRGISALRAASERARSDLLIDLKNPSGRTVGALLRLLTEGFLRPSVDALLHRKYRALAYQWIAAFRLAGELPRVLRHRRLCRTRGPHFLDVTAGPDAR